MYLDLLLHTFFFFFFSSRRRHTRYWRDWSSDVCSSDLVENMTAWTGTLGGALLHRLLLFAITLVALFLVLRDGAWLADRALVTADRLLGDRGAHLVGKIADATRATLNGTIAAAIANGAVTG